MTRAPSLLFNTFAALSLLLCAITFIHWLRTPTLSAEVARLLKNRIEPSSMRDLRWLPPPRPPVPPPPPLKFRPPLPLDAIAFAVLPTAWTVTRLASRRRRPAPGHCPTCDYDLRASPTQCPECGAKSA